MNRLVLFATCIAVLLVTSVGSTDSRQTPELTPAPLNEETWDIARAKIIEVDERTAMIGSAFVRDAELTNGILEVDVKVNDGNARSYPGFVFRAISNTDAERVYVRPHRAPLYDDTVQYTAVFHGVSGWQLDTGEGRTAAADIPVNEWFTMRLEILGTRAELSINGEPVLEIDRLRHGERSGRFGLIGPPDGTACFANFRWVSTDQIDLGAANPVMTPPGLITEWQLSQAMPWSAIDAVRLPSHEDLMSMQWTPVTADPDGRVDIAQYIPPAVAGPPTVIARTTIHSDTPRNLPLRFGYSDRITVFVNGTPVFRGISDYRSRDSGFLGAVGLYDLVFLPLKEGDNELALQITETFGGWGFICQNGEAVVQADGVRELWHAGGDLETPESVLWDEERGVLYLSCFDAFTLRRGRGQQHLSRLSSDGTITDRIWVDGLSNPSGLAWRDGKILVVERSGLAVVDPDAATIVEHILIPAGRLLNDIAVADDGTSYISDSNGRAIFRVDGSNEAERWLDLGEVGNPNGLAVDGDTLYVALNPSHEVVAVDRTDQSVRKVATLPSGLVDGLEVLPNGTLLVSFGQGWLIHVDHGGNVTTVYDTSAVDRQAADIELVADQRRLYIPTYYDGQLTALELPEAMFTD